MLTLHLHTQIVTEYERAVILRLGRLSSKKAKGPGKSSTKQFQFNSIIWLGLFFVIPCTDTVNKIDLRTITLDIPPQEVNKKAANVLLIWYHY